MKTFFLLALIFLITYTVCAQDTLFTSLSNTWQKYDKKSGYSSFRDDTKVIHFWLPDENSDFIEIKHGQPFSVFFNDKLVLTNQRKVAWSVDSLKSVYSPGMRISIHSEQGIKGLSTQAISIVEDQNKKLETDHVQNAMITVSIILLIAVVMLFRTGPQAAFEYFNVVKVFSVRNIDEGAVTTRVTSINNVFFYIFCSTLAAINLFTFSYQLLPENASGFNQYIINILYLIGVVFLILILKIVIVSLTARLFKLSEFAPNQFYNFVRLLLIVFSLSSIILLINFMLGGNSESLRPFLIGFIVSLLLVFTMVTYIKLNSRGGFTVFHLFSYLCASEIIPLFILLNIYFPKANLISC